ncbi:MAG: hypothetical protein AAFV80_18975, partial [Bacteroidota bacterium]
MKEEEFINLFKSEADQVADQPPKHLWDRLDSKLEARRSEKRMIFFRRTAIAASIALIIGLAATLPIFNPQAPSLVSADNTGPLTAMNDEVIVNDFSGGFIMTKAEQEAYYESLDNIKAYNSISRDDNKQLADNYQPSKKFKVRKNNTQEAKAAPLPDASCNTQDVALEPNDIAFVVDEGTNDGFANSSSDSIVTPGNQVLVFNDSERNSSNNNFDQVEEVEKPAASTTTEQTVLADALTADRTEQENIEVLAASEDQAFLEEEAEIDWSKAEERPARNRRGKTAKKAQAKQESIPELAPMTESNTIDLDLEKRSIDYRYTNTKTNQTTINQLRWILGKWTDPTGKSYETWEQKD